MTFYITSYVRFAVPYWRRILSHKLVNQAPPIGPPLFPTAGPETLKKSLKKYGIVTRQDFSVFLQSFLAEENFEHSC